MKIIVTGASGYLGSQLANYLCQKHEVYALIRHSSCSSRLLQDGLYIKRAEKNLELDSVFNDVNPDVVINTVALYGRRGESLSDLVESNISFPLKIFELAEKYCVNAFIHTGTSLPSNVSPYAFTKKTFPEIIKYRNGKTKFLNIELEHFYGPRDDSSKFISYVIEQCFNSTSLDLTSGCQLRDFIYIEDVTSAYEVILDNLGKLRNHESIPLGSGDAYKIKDVVQAIWRICNSQTLLNFGAIPLRENEHMYSSADIGKLKDLGWEAKYSLYDGLKKTILEK